MYDLDSIYWLSTLNFAALIIIALILWGQDKKLRKICQENEMKIKQLNDKLKAIITLKD